MAALRLAGVSINAGTNINKAAGKPSQVAYGVSLHESWSFSATRSIEMTWVAGQKFLCSET
ncbi:hypothetical protein N7520_006652 [Penicillium odoratum]|uniref:uncharacterized protein n=1 Tax=Penicillium odoratum TaxID=1167516 RepID=UPI002549B019|nr:uncharacterized protein N7520_006652 [Penicillium odoratum]KAJ5759496.1 hypothetical protein N7520_006652 [Penicillium odoratum]